MQSDLPIIQPGQKPQNLPIAFILISRPPLLFSKFTAYRTSCISHDYPPPTHTRSATRLPQSSLTHSRENHGNVEDIGQHGDGPVPDPRTDDPVPDPEIDIPVPDPKIDKGGTLIARTEDVVLTQIYLAIETILTC